ncbi:hypothetical protein J7L33_01275, partial [Candidatus Bathyarchaeota archaeon]|nr:hypothetical protein [Candidatus Bathyarchaeota archaeon]
MPFREHRRRLRAIITSQERLLWRWETPPLSFRRYLAVLIGSYTMWAKRKPERKELYERMIDYIRNTLRPRLEEFHERLMEIAETPVTEANIFDVKITLYDLKKEERDYFRFARVSLFRWHPEFETLRDRLSELIERLESQIGRLVRLIGEERYQLIGVDSDTGYVIYYDFVENDYDEYRVEDIILPEKVPKPGVAPVQESDELEVALTFSIETEGGHEPFVAEATIYTTIGGMTRADIERLTRELQTKLADFIREKFDMPKIRKRLEAGEPIDPRILLSEKLEPTSRLSRAIEDIAKRLGVLKAGVEYRITTEVPRGIAHIII